MAAKKTAKRGPQKQRVQQRRMRQMSAEVESLATQLRKRILQAATQLERYLSRMRKDLGWGSAQAKGKGAAEKKTAPKTGKRTSP